MSDWQPARLFHRCPSQTVESPSEIARVNKARELVVRIRPIEGKSPCGGQRLEIHPEDVKKFRDDAEIVLSYSGFIWCCEHDVDTD